MSKYFWDDLWEILRSLRFHPGGGGASSGPGIGIAGIVLIILAAVILGVALVTVILVAVIRQLHNNSGPRKTEEVTVLGKRAVPAGTRRNTVDGWWYYIGFQFADGRQQEFFVSRNQYGLVNAGDVVRITYAGEQFIDLQRRHEPTPQYYQ